MFVNPAEITLVATCKSPDVNVVTVLLVESSENVIEEPSITNLTLEAILAPDALIALTLI